MARPITSPPVVAALRKLGDGNGGFLRPEHVVEAAKPPDSPLHGFFTWEDSLAAQRYRLEEARRLIRVVVAVVPGLKTTDPVRVFVSLRGDRTNVGGYRTTVSVLSDRAMREQLVEEALADMEIFRKRYYRIRELVRVFAEMRRVAPRLRKRSKVSA